MTGSNELMGECIYRMGATTYDFSEGELIFGEDFDIVEPVPLSDIDKTRASSVFLGTVFEKADKESREGDKVSLTVGISDGASGAYAKRRLPKEEAEWFKKFKEGTPVAVFGKVMRDKFDNEPFISIKV